MISSVRADVTFSMLEYESSEDRRLKAGLGDCDMLGLDRRSDSRWRIAAD